MTAIDTTGWTSIGTSDNADFYEVEPGMLAVVPREAPDPALQVCFALVGSSPFGRAVGSVFLGLSRPRVPTRMFGSFDDAAAWIRQVVG